MTDGTRVSMVVCDECGLITVSHDSNAVIEGAEKHTSLNPEHQLYLHVLDSVESRKL